MLRDRLAAIFDSQVYPRPNCLLSEKHKALTLQPLAFLEKKNKGNPEKKQGFFSSRNP